jgi:ribulose-phosphate 3-epimerase
VDTQILLSASILSADFARLGNSVREAEDAGVDWIHIDVMDGHFVPNLTMGPLIVQACRRSTRLPLDVHLMIMEPIRYLEEFSQAGATTITVHAEACTHLHRTLQKVRDLGCNAGLAINPGTGVGVIEPVLELTDLILVMSVNPGFSGQTFLRSSIDKIAQARQTLRDAESPSFLQVDGGVSAETAPAVVGAGANVLAAASSIFLHPAGIREGVAALRQAVARSKA